jgi:hypothetical protein
LLSRLLRLFIFLVENKIKILITFLFLLIVTYKMVRQDDEQPEPVQDSEGEEEISTSKRKYVKKGPLSDKALETRRANAKKAQDVRHQESRDRLEIKEKEMELLKTIKTRFEGEQTIKPKKKKHVLPPTPTESEEENTDPESESESDSEEEVVIYKPTRAMKKVKARTKKPSLQRKPRNSSQIPDDVLQQLKDMQEQIKLLTVPSTSHKESKPMSHKDHVIKQATNRILNF